MVYVILPAYNEEKALGLLLEKFRNLKEEISLIVVNDGSSDGTEQVAQNFTGKKVILVKHFRNKGLGTTLKSGLNKALSLIAPEDVVVTMDSDNTHEPSLIPSMIEQIRAGNDIVIASRYVEGGEEKGLSFLRSFLSKGASFTFKLFLPVDGVRDYSCGYRAYRGDLLRKAYLTYKDQLIESKGFTCMVELLVKLSAFKPKVAEVPLVLRYDQKEGKSKMKIIKTIWQYLTLIYNFRSKKGVDAK